MIPIIAFHHPTHRSTTKRERVYQRQFGRSTYETAHAFNVMCRGTSPAIAGVGESSDMDRQERVEEGSWMWEKLSDGSGSLTGQSLEVQDFVKTDGNDLESESTDTEHTEPGTEMPNNDFYEAKIVHREKSARELDREAADC
ncbi:hypothetical protein B7494_g938 [Chlorociboria aeruginascens]|nr:hypothetical protein B7494_g938 [Chlorociboria aeruginascens]